LILQQSERSIKQEVSGTKISRIPIIDKKVIYHTHKLKKNSMAKGQSLYS